MEIDVREEGVITKIVFSDRCGSGIIDGKVQAHYMTQKMGVVGIHDSHEFVLVESAEHAENLIKALNQAIQLGWLK